MACWDERPGEQLRLPLLPAIAPSEHDRERRDPPVSVRCRERDVSGVAHLAHPQDLESADSKKVVTCAVFAQLRLLDFPPRPLPRNNEDAATPFSLPCL